VIFDAGKRVWAHDHQGNPAAGWCARKPICIVRDAKIGS